MWESHILYSQSRDRLRKADPGKAKKKKYFLVGRGDSSKTEKWLLHQIDTVQKGRINYISTLQRKSGVLGTLNKKGGKC